MNINILSKSEIENIIDEKIRTSLKEINNQLDYIYTNIESMQENIKVMKK
jgi:hypothetical protein